MTKFNAVTGKFEKADGEVIGFEKADGEVIGAKADAIEIDHEPCWATYQNSLMDDLFVLDTKLKKAGSGLVEVVAQLARHQIGNF
jgi:hypothetical protein